MKKSLPYEINDKMVIISKTDYERCVLRGLITDAPSLLITKQENPIAEQKQRLFVLNVEHFCGHPETGTDVTNGTCPHCGRFISQRDYNKESCDYCGGLIQWSMF